MSSKISIAAIKKSKVLLIGGIFILWRLSLLGITWLAEELFVYKPTFPYAKTLLKTSGLPRWLYSWANFDGVHYLTIIKNGYMQTDYIQAFFPMYPLLSKTLYYLGFEPISTGLIVANLTALALLIIWYYFLRNFFSKREALIGVLLLITFPTAFYLGAFYTESIFMVLTIGAFYAAHKERWLIMGLLTALATATRVVGIVLVPALLIEIYMQANGLNTLGELIERIQNTSLRATLQVLHRKYIFAFAAALIGSVGLIGYMLYLNKYFNDPLYFFHVQSEFGGGRSEQLVLYPQVVWRYIKILTTNALNWRYLTSWQEAVAGVAGFIGLLTALKTVRLSWVLYSLGIFIIPTLTGTFSSMPRYILPCFAIFIFLTQIFSKHQKLLYVYLLVSSLLLAINTMLFVQGYWVA